ncbi:MAG: LysM peptidoglycan-binding domain-containing protein [Candidatus Scalindua sp.]|jgi:nucleoid-associated protein YgaU|nr:LysM peptidoglycan-binding domain-containing protein [Candidatus Scalindua sp.]MDV5166685.1 LysM peptidoglycan-binding domain-containing protein [Candidatus Scalindua sp.]
MRRDTQIGIILGIVILVIIGVFLSTRATDNVTALPDLVLSEGARQKTEVQEININGFFKESKKAEPEEEQVVEYYSEEAQISEEIVESTQLEMQPEATIVETSYEDTSLEGKWEGVAEEIVEEIEIVAEIEIADQVEEIEEVLIVQDIPSDESVVISEEDSQTTSYSSSTEDVYYRVQSNDNLFKIARKHYGDGQKWSKIFEANRDTMPDSNSLYVGQELLIPDITIKKEVNDIVVRPVSGRMDNMRSGNVDTHTVEAGDTLYRIAEKYYDNPGKWTKILEANEDTLEDEGSLKKGQVIVIPRL